MWSCYRVLTNICNFLPSGSFSLRFLPFKAWVVWTVISPRICLWFGQTVIAEIDSEYMKFLYQMAALHIVKVHLSDLFPCNFFMWIHYAVIIVSSKLLRYKINQYSINFTTPCAANMRQRTRSAFVHVMAYRPFLSTGLFGTNFMSGIQIQIHSRKYIWKCRLWNGGHFVQGRWVNNWHHLRVV